MTPDQQRIPAFQRGVAFRQWMEQYGVRWDAIEVSRHYDAIHAERTRQEQVKREKQMKKRRPAA